MSSKNKKIFGFSLLGLGIILILFASLITGKVDQGQRKIRKAQRGVNTARTITGVTPYSREVGRAATSGVQRKINRGKKKVKKFGALSLIMFIVGGLSALYGSFLLYIGYDTKKRR